MDEKSAMDRETSQLVQCELIFCNMSEVHRFQLSQLTVCRQKLGTILENNPFGIPICSFGVWDCSHYKENPEKLVIICT